MLTLFSVLNSEDFNILYFVCFRQHFSPYSCCICASFDYAFLPTLYRIIKYIWTNFYTNDSWFCM